MGNPEMRWQDSDGSLQLDYPRGIRTFMVQIGTNGSKEIVRSTMSLTESQMGHCGPDGTCIFAHAKLFFYGQPR
jgi:hypothetical protein